MISQSEVEEFIPLVRLQNMDWDSFGGVELLTIKCLDEDTIHSTEESSNINISQSSGTETDPPPTNEDERSVQNVPLSSQATEVRDYK